MTYQPNDQTLWPCPRCQARIPSTSTFCPNCGLSLTAAQPVPPQAPTPPAATAKTSNPLAGIVGLLVIGVLIWYFFLRSPASPGTGTRPAVQPPAVQPPAANEALPRTYAGTSDQETTSFTLAGGDYVVDWTAQYLGEYPDIGCFFAPYLSEDDGTGFEDIANVDVKGTLQRGTANLHDVSAGTWFFNVIAGSSCSWTLAIHR